MIADDAAVEDEIGAEMAGMPPTTIRLCASRMNATESQPPQFRDEVALDKIRGKHRRIPSAQHRLRLATESLTRLVIDALPDSSDSSRTTSSWHGAEAQRYDGACSGLRHRMDRTAAGEFHRD